jgi:amino acid transporter
MEDGPENRKKLEKNLRLFDVFAICTGAMFSSGFFLLPGLAAAQAGPSVVLAYLVASIMIAPAMLSVAELSTAMPRSGGTYFFIDRAMGPLAGTVGGIGTWVALVLKSAFALIGMGAYLAIFFDVPIRPLAVALTLGFVGLNIFGAKETTGLQNILVVTLLVILAYFCALGVGEIVGVQGWTRTWEEFEPFMPFGFDGMLATVGFVFVSYAGLTKVSSVAEEVDDPDRNIPLGMGLSLVVATAVYCIGVFIMVALLEPSALHSDLTPVATAATVFMDFLPLDLGVILITVSATAAFASTGNAGVLSASRYPLAMARDGLLPAQFARIGRFGTPTIGILATGGTMIACLVLLDIEAVVKLASAFQLLVFGLLNLAVIVMRESEIDFYRPGFRSPLYPWVQIAGFVIPFILIAGMGWGPVLMSLVVGLVALGWYFYYAAGRVMRSGAIYHVFQRLGQHQNVELDHELRHLLGLRGPSVDDQYEEVLSQAVTLDLRHAIDFESVLGLASRILARDTDCEASELFESFRQGARLGLMPVTHGTVLPHQLRADVDEPHMLIVRVRPGAKVVRGDVLDASVKRIHAFVFLISPEQRAGTHHRILSRLSLHTDLPDFLARWGRAIGEYGIKSLFSDVKMIDESETPESR